MEKTDIDRLINKLEEVEAVTKKSERSFHLAMLFLAAAVVLWFIA